MESGEIVGTAKVVLEFATNHQGTILFLACVACVVLMFLPNGVIVHLIELLKERAVLRDKIKEGRKKLERKRDKKK